MQWLTLLEMEETVCISQSANVLGKSMNPVLLPPAMDKLIWQSPKEKENFEFKPFKLRL